MPFSVLIVDDCPAMRKMIRRVLEMSGFEIGECLFAGDGNEALSLIARGGIDLVISDVNMPGLDGEELLRRMAESPELAKIPVIIVSSDGTRARADRLRAMGARSYLTKPFPPEALRAELDRVLEESHG